MMDMNALPEGCVANTISLTNPRDSCRLALVSSTFRSASQSDAVWERFLPSDYLDIIARSSAANMVDVIQSFSSKKELFLYLCDHHFLTDDGKRSFWLDKESGKKCYMLAARDIDIVWGDTPHYWEWISLPESRFQEVAKLLDVCWLEIRGKITTDKLSPDTTYVAYLVFFSRSQLSGFDHPLAEASFGISGQDSKTSCVCLDPVGARKREHNPSMEQRFWRFNTMPAYTGLHFTTKLDVAKVRCPVQRDNCWSEIELGEFHVVEGREVVELEMSLKEVKCGSWMSGLIIEGIEIRPKHVK